MVVIRVQDLDHQKMGFFYHGNMFRVPSVFVCVINNNDFMARCDGHDGVKCGTLSGKCLETSGSA